MEFTITGAVTMNLGLWINIWACNKVLKDCDPYPLRKNSVTWIWVVAGLLILLLAVSYYPTRADSNDLEQSAIRSTWIAWLVLVTIIYIAGVITHSLKTTGKKARYYRIAGTTAAFLGIIIFLTLGHQKTIDKAKEGVAFPSKQLDTPAP